MKGSSSKKFIIFQTFSIVVPTFLLSFQYFGNFNVLGIFAAVIWILIIYSNRTFRCIYLLSVPQIFTKRGRHAILAFAYARLIHGPLKNISNNRKIIVGNFKCFKDAVKAIIEDIKSAMSDSADYFAKTIDQLIPNLKEINDKINKSIELTMKVSNYLADTIQKASEWLADATDLCSKDQTPYDRCMKTFETLRAECLDKDDKNFECQFGRFKPVCAFMKIFDVACDDVRENFIDPMMKSIESEKC